MRFTTSVALVCCIGAGQAAAQAVEKSIRPEVRQTVPIVTAVRASAIEVAKTRRPLGRPETLIAAVADGTVPVNARFQNWTRAFKTRAIAAGIDERVVETALSGVTYDAEVIRRDRNQSEFTKTIWDYLDTAVSDTRIRNGQAALDRHRNTLQQIEDRFGVEKKVVVAIWGLESAYGTFRGKDSVIRSLATLAFDARRSAFFETQLIEALRILESGDTTPEKMTGSWAGAMGHTQFIPTSYQDYAVDFTGDGRRDIWSDDPADALASTAAYLRAFGWTTGQPWGVEVRLPEGFDYATARRDLTRLPSEWARLGVVDIAGRAVPDHGRASVLLPAGGNGAAFLVFDNFAVIERYNTADAYVIGVGHLSDRIAGGPAIQTDWPRDDRALTLKERKELQTRLTSKGFDTRGIDGKIGPLTIAAVRSFQTAHGLTPDGYASLTLLKKLRQPL